jgi:hypothetical protein
VIVVDGLEPVERRPERHRAAERRILGRRVLDHDLEPIVGAVELHSQIAVARRTILQDRLVVVIHGRGGDAGARRFEHRFEPGVDPAPARTDCEGPVLGRTDRTLHQHAAVDEIDLSEAVVTTGLVGRLTVGAQALRVGVTQADVHDAAHDLAVLGPEVTRIKIDAFEQLRRDHAR